MKKNKEKGTITLEACIVVPMFIIIMLAICGIFVLFMGQQIVTHAVIQSAKSMAYDPYAIERHASADQTDLAEMLGDISTIGTDDYVSTKHWYSDESAFLKLEAAKRFRAFISSDESKNESILDTVGIKNGINGVSFSNCKVEDGVLTMSVKYTQCFILDAAGLGEFDREITVKVKLFTYSKIGGNVYEVLFDSKGGSLITNRITPESNMELPRPSKSGYIFAGWSSSSMAKDPDIKTLEDAKAFGEKSNGVATLYAVWEKAPAEVYTYGDMRVDSLTDQSVVVYLSTDLEKIKEAGLQMKVTVSYVADYTTDKGEVIDCITVGGKRKERNHGAGEDNSLFGKVTKDNKKDISWSSETYTPQEPIKITFSTADSIWEWNAGTFYVRKLTIKVEFVQ